MKVTIDIPEDVLKNLLKYEVNNEVQVSLYFNGNGDFEYADVWDNENCEYIPVDGEVER